MYLSAIVVAAGRGSRLKSRTDKALVKIDSKPIIIHSLLVLERHPLVSEIILVANSGNKGALAGKLKQYRITKVRCIVEGGRRRQDSVYCGLKAASPLAQLFLVHDAARPFARKQDISAVIKEAAKTGAAVLGVPVKATIKKIKNQKSKIKNKSFLTVEKTINRNNLWQIQTPQVFARDLILAACKKFGGQDVSDDAMLVEKAGHRVSIVPGSYRNIKITTPEDLVIAKALLRYA